MQQVCAGGHATSWPKHIPNIRLVRCHKPLHISQQNMCLKCNVTWMVARVLPPPPRPSVCSPHRLIQQALSRTLFGTHTVSSSQQSHRTYRRSLTVSLDNAAKIVCQIFLPPPSLVIPGVGIHHFHSPFTLHHSPLSPLRDKAWIAMVFARVHDQDLWLSLAMCDVLVHCTSTQHAMRQGGRRPSIPSQPM